MPVDNRGKKSAQIRQFLNIDGSASRFCIKSGQGLTSNLDGGNPVNDKAAVGFSTGGVNVGKRGIMQPDSIA